MRALLRAVMWVLALAAGADAYLIGFRYLSDQQGMTDSRASVIAAGVAAVLALAVGTVPITVYQRTMRRVIARRRAAVLPRPRSAPPAEAIGPLELAAVRDMRDMADPHPHASAIATGGSAAAAPTLDRGDPGARIEDLGGPAAGFAPGAYVEADDPTAGQAHADRGEADADLAERPGRAAEREVEACEYRLTTAQRVFGADHPATFAARRDLASAYWGTGQLARATSMYETILADCQRALGPTHPDTLTCRSDLAAAYEMDGRLDEAIGLYAHTLAIREQVLGAEHPDTLSARSNLAVAYSVRDNLTRGRRDGHDR